MKSAGLVGVVILNFKVKDEILKCIESVKKSLNKKLVIIIVDNNSGDGLEAEIRKEKDIEFIQTGDNLGYSGGNNRGIKRALKLGAKYIFVLNPDTTVTPTTISNLVTGMEKVRASIANPKIYFESSKKIWFAGKIFDKKNVLATHRGVDEIDHGQYNTPEEIEDGTGAALMVNREVFESIGFFDERYFMYYEESDFCLRAKAAGFKIMYLPDSVVYHGNAKSAGLGSPLQDYFITRNRMLFAKKHLSPRVQVALFREALRNLASPTRRLAFFDFLTGKLGKGSYIK